MLPVSWHCKFWSCQCYNSISSIGLGITARPRPISLTAIIVFSKYYSIYIRQSIHLYAARWLYMCVYNVHVLAVREGYTQTYIGTSYTYYLVYYIIPLITIQCARIGIYILLCPLYVNIIYRSVTTRWP